MSNLNDEWVINFVHKSQLTEIRKLLKNQKVQLKKQAFFPMQIGHLTSDNHVVWRLDEADLIPFARSDFHLVNIFSCNSTNPLFVSTSRLLLLLRQPSFKPTNGTVTCLQIFDIGYVLLVESMSYVME